MRRSANLFYCLLERALRGTLLVNEQRSVRCCARFCLSSTACRSIAAGGVAGWEGLLPGSVGRATTLFPHGLLHCCDTRHTTLVQRSLGPDVIVSLLFAP